MVPSLKKLLRFETPSPLSNIIYTLLSVALTIIVLVLIPHSVYKDIEQQSIHPAGLDIGPDLSLHIDYAKDISATNVLNRAPERTQPFLGHTWLDLQLSPDPVWLSFPLEWKPANDEVSAPLELYVELGFATLNDVTLMLVDATGEVIEKQRSGDHIEESMRPIPTSHPLFSFTVKPEKKYQVLI